MAKKPKLGKAAAKVIDRQKMGPEPSYVGVPTESQMANYYNWLSHFYSAGEGKEFLLQFLTKMNANPHKIALVEKMPDAFFVPRTSILWNCRILNRGMQLEPGIMQRFKDKLAKMLADAANYSDSDTGTANSEVRVSVAVYTERKALNLSADIDDLIDEYLRGGDDDWDERLNKIQITTATAKHLVEFYQKQLSEIDLAISGKDPEVAEGYAGYTKPDLKRLAAFLEKIINHLNMTASQEKPRKRRTRKIKTPEELTRKVKYQQSDATYKLTSVKPASIIGASEVWLFNTKMRKLTVLRASEPSGLTVKGTTVLGFEEGRSVCRKLRKPETTLPEIVGGGKVAVRQAFDKLSTTASIASGRINEDTILVRTFK